VSEDQKIATMEDRIGGLERELDRMRQELSQARLEQWEGRIDDLEVQAHLGSMEINQRLEPIIETLRNRWLDAKEQLDNASSTANDVFTILRKGFEQSLRDLKDAVSNAKTTVTS
jgi:hypothetical protein